MVYQYCNDFNLYGDHEEKRRENNYPGVVLTTAHSSKGMEWNVVFNSLSKYDDKSIHTTKSYRNNDIAEERRRLLFVSATRAKKELYITSTYVAYGSGKDMRLNIFLEEACKAADAPYNDGAIRYELDAKRKERSRKRAEEKKKAQDEIIRQINQAQAAMREKAAKAS